VIEITITSEGLFSPWWSKDLDEILKEFGISEEDPNRNPWCG